ncbi:MAG TPA: glycosyltransferase, partial [Polyangia bacterium]
LDLVPLVPDVIHCHNLHNDYFDLRALPRLSRRRPLVLTLHDAWLLTGHCAHSLDCERWTSGCGHCPRLDVYPRLWRDGTAGNWARKQALAAASRLFVTAPSRWLLDRVQRSLLAPGVVDSRVIPNGVDTDRFQPAARPAARAALGLPRAPLMLLFIAEEMRRNPWKDYATLREACARVAAAVPDRRVLLVGLGDARDATERAGNLEVRLLRYEDDLARVARYYQAADVYLHASRADTFPYAVLEAMACGTPVVATAVGGIPEQLDDGATGRLVPPGDAAAMAAAVLDLARDPAKRAAFGTAAVAAVRRRFGLARCVDEYLAWYESVATRWERP